MPLPIIAGLAVGVATGALQKYKSSQLARELEETDFDMPQGAYEALQIHKSLAQMGLPGYEEIVGNIQGQLPETISQIKDAASTPSGVLGAVSQAQENSLGQIRQVDIQDAIAKAQNQKELANAMWGFGMAESELEKLEKEYDVAGKRERSSGTASMVNSIIQGASSGMSVMGAMKQGQYYDSLNKGLDGGGDGGFEIEGYDFEQGGDVINPNATASYYSGAYGGDSFYGSGEIFSDPSIDYNFKV